MGKRQRITVGCACPSDDSEDDHDDDDEEPQSDDDADSRDESSVDGPAAEWESESDDSVSDSDAVPVTTDDAARVRLLRQPVWPACAVSPTNPQLGAVMAFWLAHHAAERPIRFDELDDATQKRLLGATPS